MRSGSFKDYIKQVIYNNIYRERGGGGREREGDLVVNNHQWLQLNQIT